MATELQKRFRQLCTDIANLQWVDVHVAASSMFGKGCLNKMEFDTIKDNTVEAGSKLFDFTYDRGDESIKGLAIALTDINMLALAKKIYPDVSKTSVTPLASAAENSDGGAATAVSRKELSENLRLASVDLQEQLSAENVAESLEKRYSNAKKCITKREKETIETERREVTELRPRERLQRTSTKLCHMLSESDVHKLAGTLWATYAINSFEREYVRSQTPSHAAMALLDIIYKRGDQAVIRFQEGLKDIERGDLSQMLLPLAGTSIRNAANASDGNLTSRNDSNDEPSEDIVLPSTMESGVSSSQPQSNCTEQVLKISKSFGDHQPMAPQTTQKDVFTDTEISVYYAVQLRMSMRHTHLEVQVLVHNDKQALLNWQLKWKEQWEDDPVTYQPESVILLSINQPIVAKLTSKENSGKIVYHGGCCESNELQLSDMDRPKLHTWLFELKCKEVLEKRVFALHLLKATETVDTLFRVIDIKDYIGSCFLYQLGFTINNQSLKDGPATMSTFGRQVTAGGVLAVQTIKPIYDVAQSVGKIVIKDGPWLGTGFCVGNGCHKYIMTCHHVIKDNKEDLNDGKLCVMIGEADCGAATFHLGECVAENDYLDYAILKLNEAVSGQESSLKSKLLKPIACPRISIEDIITTQREVGEHLILVGYYLFNSIRTVDVAVQRVPVTLHGINMVKQQVSLDPEFRNSINDYDEMYRFKNDVVYYHVACHKWGASGSPVFLCKRDKVILVAVHRIGFPKFYYTNPGADRVIPTEFAIEAGTRISVIYSDLNAKNPELCQHIFSS